MKIRILDLLECLSRARCLVGSLRRSPSFLSLQPLPPRKWSQVVPQCRELQWRASAGTSSGPPFFKDWITFLISCLVGLPQLMGSSVSAGSISEWRGEGGRGGASETDLFWSSLTCSTYIFRCSSTVGLSVNGYPASAESFLVVL